jgi:hypothetical protein
MVHQPTHYWLPKNHHDMSQMLAREPAPLEIVGARQDSLQTQQTNTRNIVFEANTLEINDYEKIQGDGSCKYQCCF